ncbi:VWA domain-containing protein [Thermodesulfobacteriota bacterium]
MNIFVSYFAPMVRAFDRNGLLIAVLSLTCLWPTACLAGGFVHLFPAKVGQHTYAVARPTVAVSRALITVSESSIRYQIDQIFYNNNEFPLKGLYVLPVEKGTAPFKGVVEIDGRTGSAHIASGKSFLPTLKRLTKETMDPSLLAVAGKDALVVDPVAMAPNQFSSFRIQYERAYDNRADHLPIGLSLIGGRYSLGPVGEMEIRVRFKPAGTVRTVLSPSHHISVFRESPYRCLVTVKERDTTIERDFLLLSLLSGDRLDSRILTHKPPGRPGNFVAFLMPPTGTDNVKGPKKDVVLLLDTSGSMGTGNLGLAKRAMTFCLEGLRPHDRFNVLTIGTGTKALAKGLISANKENVLSALRFVESAKGGGGTDLYNGIIRALVQFRSRRSPALVILVGDGKGTVGITDPSSLIDDLGRHNRAGAKFFALAVGRAPDVVILDRMAASTGGKLVSLSPEDDFDTVLKGFFSGISKPEASSLSLEFQGIKPESLVPYPVPDIFGTQSAMVFGQYRCKEDLTAELILKGRVGGESTSLRKNILFPKVDVRYPFISSLWGMRQLAHLLGNYRMKGPDPALKTDIRRLADHFGFLIPNPPGNPDQPLGSDRSGRDGYGIVARLKWSNVPADVRLKGYRYVRGRLFRRERGRWVETSYSPSMVTRNVDFLSEEYFSLVEKAPEIGAYLAVGPEVTFVHKDGAVAVNRPAE